MYITTKPKTNKKLTMLLICLFSLSLLLPGIAAEGNTLADNKRYISAHGELHPEVVALLSGREPVEAIILLKERPDTARIAAAVKQRIEPYISREQGKNYVRQAVVNSLKDTAERTQKSLLTYLENQKTKGLVSEYHDYYIVNAIYIKAMPRTIEALAKNPLVDKILPNTEYKLQAEEENITSPSEDISIIEPSSTTAEWGIKKIGADRVWDEYNITGEGVVIGIIDTGVNWQHPALKEKFRGYDPENPNNPDPIYNWYDAVYGYTLPRDSNSGSHGTHVTGTAIGSAGINLIGVAPGAQWIAANIFTSAATTDNAKIISAGEYMLAPTDADGNPNPDMAPDIINCSWGAHMTGSKSTDEALREMVQNWRAAGILPVMAACNYGPESGSIGMPAIYPESFAVAATDSSNKIYNESARGPVSYYPDEIKPNISAPGVSIRSSTSTNGYNNKTGTSMASPHIAGAAALMLSLKPDLTVDLLEEIMTGTATPLPYSSSLPNSTFGHGLVDTYAAITEIYAVYYDIVFFSDYALETVIRETLNKPEALISKDDLASITALNASNYGISNLSGLEYAVNLEELDLSGNDLTNISSLENLLKLNNLNLSNNILTNISPLATNSNNGGLGEGNTVDLTYNQLYLDPEGQASSDIATLKDNGVNVLYDYQTLPRISRPQWDGPGIITWEELEHVSGYEITLYKNGGLLETMTAQPSMASYNLADKMKSGGTGNYTAAVRAKGDGQLFLDGEISQQSLVYNPIKLAQVNKPSWNSRILYWDPVDNATNYIARLYKDSNPDPIVTATIPNESVSYDFSDRIDSQTEHGIYTATVQARGDRIIYADGNVSFFSDQYIPVESLLPDDETDFFLVFDRDIAELSPLVSPAEATNKTILWSSANNNIATVSEEGVVTPRGTGNTVITATTEDGGFSANYNIDSLRYGDVSGSGSINVSDAILILRKVVDLTVFDNLQKMAADVDNDGTITVADAIMILRHIVGLIPEGFPALVQ